MDTGTGPILFYNRDEPYYEFTNFYRAEIMIDGKQWPTTEHYFQAQKFVGTPYVEQIRTLQAPRMAFNLSRDPQVSCWRRKDWEQEKVKVMYKALLVKFTQHKKLQDMLLGTGNRELIEHSPYDRYWGDGGDGSGENMLGKLLMKVRGELQGESIEVPQLTFAVPHSGSSSPPVCLPPVHSTSEVSVESQTPGKEVNPSTAQPLVTLEESVVTPESTIDNFVYPKDNLPVATNQSALPREGDNTHCIVSNLPLSASSAIDQQNSFTQLGSDEAPEKLDLSSGGNDHCDTEPQDEVSTTSIGNLDMQATGNMDGVSRERATGNDPSPPNPSTEKLDLPSGAKSHCNMDAQDEFTAVIGKLDAQPTRNIDGINPGEGNDPCLPNLSIAFSESLTRSVAIEQEDKEREQPEPDSKSSTVAFCCSNYIVFSYNDYRPRRFCSSQLTITKLQELTLKTVI